MCPAWFVGERYKMISLGEDPVDLFHFFIPRDCTGETGKTDSMPAEDCGWNCATLIGYSFCRATGINIDANRGTILYPNDIINSPVFNSSEGRLRF